MRHTSTQECAWEEGVGGWDGNQGISRDQEGVHDISILEEGPRNTETERQSIETLEAMAVTICCCFRVTALNSNDVKIEDLFFSSPARNEKRVTNSERLFTAFGCNEESFAPGTTELKKHAYNEGNFSFSELNFNLR